MKDHDTRREAAEQRRRQEAHGARSDQGDRPLEEGPKPEPTAYEGPEETNQQRR